MKRRMIYGKSYGYFVLNCVESQKMFQQRKSALSEQETERNICILYYDQISSPMRDGLIYI